MVWGCRIQDESGDCSGLMVRHARSRAHAHEFDVVEDDTATATNQHASIDANAALGSNPSALLDKPDTNIDRSHQEDFIELLTDKLRELHIYSPVKGRGRRSLRERCLTRLTTDTFPLSQTLREEAEKCAAETTHTQGPFLADRPRVTEEDEGDPSLAETPALTLAAIRQGQDSFEPSCPSKVPQASQPERNSSRIDPSIRSSVARHHAGQYDYVLSVDGSASCFGSPSYHGESSQIFGCNLLAQRQYFAPSFCSQGKPANAYRILATPLGDKERSTQDASATSAEEEDMAIAEPVGRLISPAPVENETASNKSRQSSVTVSVVEQIQRKPNEARGHVKESSESSVEVVDDLKQRVISISSSEESSVQTPRTPSRSTSASSQQSRIEDSLEAIDRLEEQLELANAAITPTSKSRRHKASIVESSCTDSSGIRRTGSLLKREQSHKTKVGPATNQPRATQRHSVAVVEKADMGSPAKAAINRSSVSRPNSLLPPKSPAKSTKLPTKPSFELPGEAVARRLKEQREARQAAQEKAAAAAVVPQRTRSLKAPTRPTFELPGEQISRRKRQEQQAKLKAEEEEQRRRREFKARPIRANLNSATYPRETATSRVRQGKGSEPTVAEQTEPSFSKRSSTSGTPRTPLTRTGSTRSPQPRGRGISQVTTATEASRATSTSTSSTSGKRSTLSAQELEQQRMKGKEVFQRDNGYREDKERERHERELNAKLAREQAAERSRQASREWAEKQRRRRMQLAEADTAARRAV